jgi:hypothetical protein
MDFEKIMKLLALIQLASNQVLPMIQRLNEQKGETKEQLDAHAERANAEARAIIDAL